MEEGLSTTKISYEAGKRTKKVKRNGIGNYCCVPNCKTTQYKVDNKAKIKKDISCFHFPKTSKRKKEWLQSISFKHKYCSGGSWTPATPNTELSVTIFNSL